MNAATALPRPRPTVVIPTVAQIRAAGPNLLGALSLIGWVWLLVQVFASDAYYLPQPHVRGNAILPVERIAAQADLPPGFHIMFVNPAQVETKLLALPEVRSARVTCQLPGKMTIQITERTPIFNWRSGDRMFWVDGEGVFLESSYLLPQSLTIQEASGVERTPGEAVDSEVIGALQRLEDLLPRVTHYEHVVGSGLRFTTPDGVQVTLGTQNLERQVQTLQALLEELRALGQTASEIHLEYKYPVVK
ncbi:MAG: FtsQ-type POTRA domain-containing protein [Chloroflexi bacterium]|nr:FtsQ-type POTRA domain-containing protein [Chloroflexota bacterium]